MKVDEVSSHRIRSALVPIVTMLGLFGRQYFDKTFPKAIKPISILNMSVKRCGIELAKQLNAIVARIEAVADRYVDQPVFACKRDGGLATQFRQWIETRTSATSHNYTMYSSLHFFLDYSCSWRKFVSFT